MGEKRPDWISPMKIKDTQVKEDGNVEYKDLKINEGGNKKLKGMDYVPAIN